MKNQVQNMKGASGKPVATVSAEIADAFGLRNLPNVRVREEMELITATKEDGRQFCRDMKNVMDAYSMGREEWIKKFGDPCGYDAWFTKQVMKREAAVTLETVRCAEFGCVNCLYAGCECENGSRFVPARTKDNKPTCKGYTYCD